jgi:spore maturation protein CgeB
MFKVGHEIETYRSSAELAEKVQYYLNNDAARNAIANNGYQSFLQNHTWAARIEKQMIPLMEIQGRGRIDA